jgi:formate dehydrogenase subunit gamma
MSSSLRIIVAALVIVFLGAVPVSAQHAQDAPPAPATKPLSGSNPTDEAMKEQQLLQQLRKLEGRVSIPDQKAALLEQPQGRSYQFFHERLLPWVAGILVVGILAALLLFYLLRGRIALEDRQTSIKILRFNVFERLTHWMTATAFIVLAITGLNYVFGKRLLFPLIGADAFATWSQWAKFAHTTMAWAFMLGLLFMIFAWIRDNIPDRYDWRWLREFGGFLSGRHPPARRFNAGQKMIYWSVILFGLTLSATGIIMLFPFWTLDINGMQWAQYIHAFAGAILTAVIIAHIYIGSLGMEGAYNAMGTGEVDLAWARAHHSLWADEQEASTGTKQPDRPPVATPAE